MAEDSQVANFTAQLCRGRVSGEEFAGHPIARRRGDLLWGKARLIMIKCSGSLTVPRSGLCAFKAKQIYKPHGQSGDWCRRAANPLGRRSHREGLFCRYTTRLQECGGKERNVSPSASLSASPLVALGLEYCSERRSSSAAHVSPQRMITQQPINLRSSSCRLKWDAAIGAMATSQRSR